MVKLYSLKPQNINSDTTCWENPNGHNREDLIKIRNEPSQTKPHNDTTFNPKP